MDTIGTAKPRFRDSLWIGWSLLLSLGWIGFFVIGARAKKKRWTLFGVLYLLLWLSPFVILGIVTMDTVISDVAAGILLFQWIPQLVHLCLCRKEYLARMAAVRENEAVIDQRVESDLPQAVKAPSACTVCGALTGRDAICPACGVPAGPGAQAENAAPSQTVRAHRPPWPVLAALCGAAAFTVGLLLILKIFDMQHPGFTWRTFDTPGYVNYFTHAGAYFSLEADPDDNSFGIIQSGWLTKPGDNVYLRKLGPTQTSLYDCNSGEPVLIADNAYEYTQAAVGDMLYYYADFDMVTQTATLMRRELGGAPETLLTGCFAPAGFSLSPDGKTLLFSRGGFVNGEQDFTLCIRDANGNVSELAKNCIPVSVADGGKYVYYAEATYHYSENGEYCWLEQHTACVTSDAGRVQLATAEDMYGGISFSFNRDLSVAIASCKATGMVVCRDGAVTVSVPDANLNVSNWYWRNGQAAYGRNLGCSECQVFYFNKANFNNAILTGQIDILDAMDAYMQGASLAPVCCLMQSESEIVELPAAYSFSGDGSLMAFTDLGCLLTTTDPAGYADQAYVDCICDDGAVLRIQNAQDCAVSGLGSWIFYRTHHGDLCRVHPDGTNETLFGRNVVSYQAVPTTDDCIYMEADGSVYVAEARGEAQREAVYLATVDPACSELIRNGEAVEIYDKYDDPNSEYHSLTKAVYIYDIDGLRTVWPRTQE